MKMREILIICLIICCLFSLQAVAAASDGNSTDSVVLTTDSNVSAYSLPNTDDQLRDGSDAGTFSDLQNDLSPGGDIVLTKNYTFDNTIDTGLANGISVPNTVNSITGSGNIVIDGSQQARIFNIHSGHSITLTGITFINANADGNGGSINSDGTLIISDCNFTNNTASGHGGAIYLGSGEGDTVTNCNFEGNVAGGNGGAVDWYAGSSNGKITGSTFTDNTAKRSGGAVHWSGHYGTIRDSNFTNNVATGEVTSEIGGIVGGGDGAAVLWVGSNGTVTNCIFDSNVAQNRGGAIFLHGNSTENCTNTTFSHSIFINNTAGLNGGAIDWQEGAQDGKVAYCDFINNTASSTGGAIYWGGYNGTIINSNFTYNKALGTVNGTGPDGSIIPGGNGGAIVWKGANGDIINSTFRLNNASRNGGAIFMQGGSNEDCTNITVDGGMFIDNYAGRNGGALDWYEGAHDADLYNSVFINNTAERSGGAVYWFGHDGTILNSTFENNTAKGTVYDYDSYGKWTSGGHGGAIMWTGANGKVLNSTFTSNNATKNGGAIYMQGSKQDGVIHDCSNITVDGSRFVDNYAGVNGGALDWYEGAHDSTLSNSIFINNTAERSGGAVYWYGHDGTILNSTFENNRAKGNASANDSYGNENKGGHGGAIMWTGANGKVLNSTFRQNNATKNGGAIYMQGSKDGDCSNITVDGSKFFDNYAGVNGGALDWYEGSHDSILSNSIFDNNTAATGNGGSVFWNGNNGQVINSSFSNNYARFEGGAVYIEGNDCLFANSTLDSNIAGDDGGAIYWTGQQGKMYNITANNNSGISFGNSHSKGGTIIITGSNMAIDQLVVTNSFANEEAGGLFLTGNNVNVTNAKFINCSASMDGTAQNITRGGGAVIIGNNTRLINVTIEDSQAERGGAIYWEGNDGYAYDVTATRNYATNEGGALFITGENCQIYKSEFTDNIAGDDGGAINWEGESGHIEGCNFENNTGLSMWDQYEHRYHTTKGGAVSITGDNLEILNSNFTDSTAKDNGYHNNVGGTLFITGENVKIDGCNFNNSVSEGSDGGTIYIIGSNTEITNSTFSNSTAKAGGAIYVEGTGTFIGSSNFTETSAKSGSKYTSDNLGGAIYIQGKDTIVSHSNFENSSAFDGGMVYIEGDNGVVMYSSLNNGYAARDGGAVYSKGSYGTVSNSSFTNNLAELSGGAMYWDGGSKSKYNTVDGCVFTNNTAHGNTTDASITRGGGAIYWSEGGTRSKITNSEFYYNSVQSTIDKKVDGGAVLWDKSTDALVDNCTFVGNFVTTNGDTPGNTASATWAQGGAMYLRPNANYTVTNSLFENCSSSKEAGALYIQGLTSSSAPMITLENCTFINNVAEGKGSNNINGGGAIQIKQCPRGTFNNLTFINNTANKAGALCVYDQVSNLVVDGATFIGNRANKGSAISASVYFKLNNAVLLNNTADTTLLDLTFNRDAGSIDILMEGADTHLNAMYVKGSKTYTVSCNNVTYWTDNNITIGQTAVQNGPITSINLGSVPEKGIAILVEIFDGDNNKLHEGIYATDANGKIHLDLADVLTDPYSTDNIYVNARLPNEDYYTMIEATTRFPVNINASALDTIFHRNTTVTANITAPGNGTGQAARGIVSVYIDDVFKGNMTIENSKGSLENIITNFTADKFFEVGNHTVFLKYWGDAYFGEANTTISFNITKAQANSTVTFDDIGYDISMNVTIFDEWDDKFYGDANGTATVEFYSESDPTVIFKSVDVIIVDGVGYTVVHDLLPKNYTVKTTYHDDHNYNSSVNTTNYSLPQKDFAAVFVDVNAYDIMVNDTIYINVTIVPPDEKYNVPGNVTLYLDNKAYNLTLTMGAKNATATFNITNLTAGLKKVIAFYEGSKLLEPAMGEADFRVHKYNTTLSANVTNITIIQNEIINITLLNDTTGVVSAIVDGKEYFGRIKNGTVSIELPQLPVGKYNVTLFYEGDNKYYNATNYTVFYVSQATPEIIIDVDNVTYGNETLIVVTLPEDATGNVTVKINDTYYVFDTQNLTDGKAILPGKVFPAGNYTLEVTYSGDENYTGRTKSAKFTVYKAKPEMDLTVKVLNVTVEDIYYGENTNITVTVPDGVTGNIALRINGTDKNITLPIVDGKVNWTVGGLAVGNYVIIANYSGNQNYTNATVTAGFNVLQIGTVLDVDVHDVPVWDTEYINITIKDAAGNVITNATGNVTIDINGVEYTAEIKDGVARFNTSNLTVGHKVAWVFYDGDRNLTGSRLKAEFDVTQRVPKVNVTALNITVDQDGKITINIPKNATGHVVLSGNFTDNLISVYDFTDGVAEVTVKDLAVGNYSVHIKYYGDDLDNYTVAENDTTFSVAKINATVSIVADNVTYGNATTIVVTVPEGVTGNITLKLNDTTGRNITLPIEGGKVTWVVEGLAAGNYTVNATYNGNDDYNINDTESAKFKVKKADPGLEFIVSGTVHESATVQIKINDEIHGKVVNVTVDGVPYANVSVDDEFKTQVLNEIKPYTIVVEYGGNENFTSARVEQTFTPSKVFNYGFNVTAMNITVGEDEIITVEVPDNVDDVVIWVDGQEYRNNSFTNNKATFNITGLKEGIYTVTAQVNDTDFNHYNVTTLFTVNKTYPSINITVVNETSIYVNDTVKVIVTVPKDVTKNVTIEINGMQFTNSTVNGNATFYIPQITYGNKTVVATYPGDDKYRFNSTTANFTVNKRKSQVNVTVDAGLVGDDTVINVTIPSNAVGYVIVNVDGTNYTVNTTNGNGSITIKGLGNTTHTVNVTYIGDDQYLPSENSTTFGIPKANTTIAIAVQNITYGESANITVTVENDATGYITIRIDNIRNVTLPVINGTVNWIVDNLPADNYTVYANYSGDGKYNKNETSKGFEVSQISPEIKIIEVISTADKNATIIVEIDPRVSENITVNVNNKNYTAKPVNGIAVVTTDVLDYNDYTINASYAGDKNFTKGYDIYNFITNQTDDYLINITASDINVRDNTNITVNVPADATGKVIIELNGTNYTATISGGKAVLDNVSTLKEGVYNVTAYFGSDKYVNKTVETRFAVSKVDTPIAITVINETSILVNDTVKVVVTVPSDVTENVTIEINGMRFINSTVNGNATFYIPSITYGNKTVVATYPGDDKYRFNSTTAKFTVNKRNSQVNVTVDAGLVGDDVVINVTIPANATGYVIVSVDGTNYTVNTTNGNGSVSIKGLGNTTHTVHVTYIGDDQYLPSENSTTFGIPKGNTTIAIAVESIDYGQKANITVTVKDDATGYITIKINDTREITLPVVNGTVNWIVEDLAAGNYTVYANYSGDDKYNGNKTNKTFEVRQISPDIKIISVISTAGENATIIVEIDPRVSGNITVHVDKDYSVKPVNGIAVVTTDVLDYGNYTVNASYAGDKNFTKDYDIYKFTTNQTDDYLINITASDIEVGDNTNITVNVPSDATGKVIIELNGTNYTVTIADGKAVLDNVSTLEEGVYNVTAYFGDDKYANKTVQTRFVVSKGDTPMKITVVNDTSIYVNDTVKVVVTVPSDVTENVTIEINGMEFTNSTVNGNATFYIPQITYGNKTVVAIYPGDDKYRFNSTTANFTVNKRDSFINVDATDGVVDGEVIINVTVPENAIGYVVVNVNGTNYTINLTNGDDRVVVKVTEAGLYNVTVTYIGDDQFLPSNNTTSFKVDKLPSFINVTVNDNGIIANGSDVYINITAPEDITGNVTVIVWDKDRNVNTTYENVYVNGGKAELHIAAPDIGNYSVTAIYLENRKYLGNENYTSFEVYDTTKELDVEPQNITFGSDETVLVIIDGNHVGDTLTIIITNASGEVIRNESVKIDRYMSNRNFSIANWNLKLDAGKYNASAIYVDVDGAKTYTYEGSNSFVVYKAASTIKIKEIRNVTVGDNVTIELEVSPDTATGNISVFVNGVEYKTTTDNLTITIPNLRADNYTVEAFYHGDKNHNGSNASSLFRVDKLTVPLSIDIENRGDVVQINVTVGNNATGQILLDIEDNHYYANITNGVAQFNITGLKAGKHNVTAWYAENDKYYGNTTNSSFTISKYQPEFTINGTDIDFGNAELITFETKDDITSLVEVEVNGRNYTTFIKNGKGNLTLNDLAAGDYNITLYFPANEKYESATANGSFKVSQIAPDINVVVQNITYGEVETIIVYVNAEGNVTIDVGGYEFIEKPLINGIVSVDVPYLNANNYTVNVTYNGNANYTRSNAKSNFTVYKADPIITFEVEDIFYGDVEHIIVHVNAEGNVTVTVDNRTVEEISLENGKVTLKASRWNVPDYNGNATVNVEGLDAGHYPVVAIFNGNENYNKATATVDFEVYKVNTTVSVEAAPSMKIGESQVINITVNNTNATGNVIVIVDGVNNTVPVTNGTANFTIDATTAGNHTIVVIYEGDNNLNGNWTSATFEVTKLDAPINMTISNSTVGGKQTITVEVPANATGQVLIDINGQPYYANVSDGKAILEIDTLPAGEYDVVATYLGDDTYLRNSTSDKFNVTKNNSTLEITPQNITCGESETITFTVPEDAIGNITVVVNNETHTVPVSGGTGTLTIPKLPAGNYTINATYNGDGKYKPVTSSAEFEVSKANDTDIKVIDQGNGTVVVTVPDDATGNVTIKIGDENYTAPVVNGTAVITLTNATPGTHEIEVVYSGDGNYTNATKLANVTIPKYDTPIEVSVSDIKVGDKAVVEVKLPENATGNVTIEINGKEYTTDKITDGVARFEVENLTYGNKTVAVKYSGDDNYVGNFTTGNFTVSKRNSTVNVTVSPISVGEDLIVNVTIPANATGYVIVNVDGTEYSVNTTDGNGTVAIKGIGNGTHTINVTYIGDDQYLPSSNSTTVSASKVPSTVNVTAEDISLGDVAVINITVPEDATGNITVNVNGTEVTVGIVNGTATAVIPGLKVGNYTVNVTYNGDGKYLPNSNVTTFEVGKATTSDIKVIDQGNGTVVVTVPDNATGNVTIKIGDENYTAPVVNGTAVITLTNATPGTHDIEVIYSGDENHTAATTNATVTIPKYDAPISVSVSDIKVGDKAIVEVKLPENATGNVTIEIDGKKYITDNITDGVARFEVEDLTYGNKTVAVKYSGDDNYLGNYTTGNFTVDKRESFVTVDVEPANVGEDVTVKVNVPENATGWVHVTIDNQTYAIKVTDGVGTATIKGLASGNHTVDVEYLGDEQYFNSTNSTTVKVSKVPASINVTVDDITVGENAVINIETPEDLCGNVTVTVDGKNYTVPVSGGKGTLVVPGLTVGNKTVDVAFDGCKKYEPASNSTTFEVSKVNTTESSIKVIDQGNRTVVVTVPDNATGNVTIKVGNETYTGPVVNGTAVITLTNTTPGTHDIEVIYSGDENHTAATTNATVTIPKHPTPIKVTTENINVGDTTTITVEVPEDATGNVTIEIDGKKYTTEIKDGKATFNIENLTAGNKTVAVDYVGDDNYTGNHTTGNFTVSKVAPEITVKATNSTVGDKVVIEVTAPSDVTRPVLVDVGGKGYYVNITDGKGTLEIDDLTSGNYTVTAKYLGDDKYTPSNATGSFKVDKVPSTVSVEVDDITVGDKAVITVKVPKDATGNVTVTVDGKDYNVSVADGKGTLVIPGLKAGNYTVDAKYNGDDKYESSSSSTEFEVSKKDIDDMKVIDQGNGTVVVVVGDNATGNVTIKVGNNTYTVPVENGTAVVDLSNETPGKHDIEVIYSGDDTHEGQTTDATVTIPKLDTPISVDVKDSKVGNTSVITVNVPDDATGNVTIEVDGNKYTAEIKDGKAVFEVPGLTAGNKTVAVDYVGDDNYTGNHTTAKFTVSKVPSTVSATVEDSKVGENVTVKVTVPEDATGQVLVDINGVGYYVNVTNGTGSVEIPRVPSGKYDVNVTYLGDDKYLPSSNKTSFNVDKLPSYVIPTAKDIAVGDTEKITFELPEDATGTLTVIIDGEEFTVDLDTLGAIDADGNKFTVAVSDGKAVLTINDLPKGEYTVEVRYNGDDKYMPSTNSTKFTVSKTSTDMEITDNGDGTVKVELPDDATGNVTIKVGNNTYTVPVVNGTAIVNLTNATPGTHDIEVIYSGDDKYGSQDKNSTVTIPKYDTPISVEVEDINVGDTAKITVNVPEDATGTVTIEINGKEYTAEIKDGKAVFEVPDLTAGDKTVAVKYAGDKNYVGNFTTGNFTVSKVPSTASATSKDIKVGKDEVITVTVPKDATGRVLVDINGVGYYADIVNGKAKVIVPELPSGKYTAKVTYEGDDKYLPSTTTTKFTVTKNEAPISASGDEIPQGKDATVVVKVPSDATGTVTITVDGKKYTAEVKDGKAVFVIPGLTKGDHGVTAVYSGDKKYDANDTITDIEVVYPDNPNNGGDHGEADVAHNGDGIDLSQHATGNPILVLLLIIMVIGSTQIRRFRK